MKDRKDQDSALKMCLKNNGKKAGMVEVFGMVWNMWPFGEGVLHWVRSLHYPLNSPPPRGPRCELTDVSATMLLFCHHGL